MYTWQSAVRPSLDIFFHLYHHSAVCLVILLALLSIPASLYALCVWLHFVFMKCDKFLSICHISTVSILLSTYFFIVPASAQCSGIQYRKDFTILIFNVLFIWLYVTILFFPKSMCAIILMAFLGEKVPEGTTGEIINDLSAIPHSPL